jgi:hypothetical protein
MSSYFAPVSPTPRSSPLTSLPLQAFSALSHQVMQALPDDWAPQINHPTPFVPDIPCSIHIHVRQVRTPLHLLPETHLL